MDGRATPLRASRNRSAEQKLAEIRADERCPCGHLATRHAKADPDWKVGDFQQITGACRDCECKGEIG